MWNPMGFSSTLHWPQSGVVQSARVDNHGLFSCSCMRARISKPCSANEQCARNVNTRPLVGRPSRSDRTRGRCSGMATRPTSCASGSTRWRRRHIRLANHARCHRASAAHRRCVRYGWPPVQCRLRPTRRFAVAGSRLNPSASPTAMGRPAVISHATLVT